MRTHRNAFLHRPCMVHLLLAEIHIMLSALYLCYLDDLEVGSNRHVTRHFIQFQWLQNPKWAGC